MDGCGEERHALNPQRIDGVPSWQLKPRKFLGWAIRNVNARGISFPPDLANGLLRRSQNKTPHCVSLTQMSERNEREKEGNEIRVVRRRRSHPPSLLEEQITLFLHSGLGTPHNFLLLDKLDTQSQGQHPPRRKFT